MNVFIFWGKKARRNEKRDGLKTRKLKIDPPARTLISTDLVAQTDVVIISLQYYNI